MCLKIFWTLLFKKIILFHHVLNEIIFPYIEWKAYIFKKKGFV
jgi:hypothetical protein